MNRVALLGGYGGGNSSAARSAPTDPPEDTRNLRPTGNPTESALNRENNVKVALIQNRAGLEPWHGEGAG